jgi:hypothetical protein
VFPLFDMMISTMIIPFERKSCKWFLKWEAKLLAGQ